MVQMIPPGIEPGTYCLGGSCSIQLGQGTIVVPLIIVPPNYLYFKLIHNYLSDLGVRRFPLFF